MDNLRACGTSGKMEAVDPFDTDWAKELVAGFLGDECPDLDTPEFPALFVWAFEVGKVRYPDMGINEALHNAFSDVFTQPRR